METWSGDWSQVRIWFCNWRLSFFWTPLLSLPQGGQCWGTGRWGLRHQEWVMKDLSLQDRLRAVANSPWLQEPSTLMGVRWGYRSWSHVGYGWDGCSRKRGREGHLGSHPPPQLSLPLAAKSLYLPAARLHPGGGSFRLIPFVGKWIAPLGYVLRGARILLYQSVNPKHCVTTMQNSVT